MVILASNHHPRLESESVSKWISHPLPVEVYPVEKQCTLCINLAYLSTTSAELSHLLASIF